MHKQTKKNNEKKNNDDSDPGKINKENALLKITIDSNKNDILEFKSQIRKIANLNKKNGTIINNSEAI